LLATVESAPAPPGPSPSNDNTTTIILCSVGAIIVIIAVTIWCIKRNKAKRMNIDGDRNQLVQKNMEEERAQKQMEKEQRMNTRPGGGRYRSLKL
jgi:hypothetical protein